LSTTVVHNTTENSSDNFPAYPPDNNHILDDLYWKAGGRAVYHINLDFLLPQL